MTKVMKKVASGPQRVEGSKRFFAFHGKIRFFAFHGKIRLRTFR